MKRFSKATARPVWVAIDVAKATHEVLVERSDGARKCISVANTQADFEKLAKYLATLSPSCEVALEPTGDYHRPIANFLLRRGHKVHFVSSIATNRPVKHSIILGIRTIRKTLRSFCTYLKAA